MWAYMYVCVCMGRGGGGMRACCWVMKGLEWISLTQAQFSVGQCLVVASERHDVTWWKKRNQKTEMDMQEDRPSSRYADQTLASFTQTHTHSIFPSASIQLWLSYIQVCINIHWGPWLLWVALMICTSLDILIASPIFLSIGPPTSPSSLHSSVVYTFQTFKITD